LDGRHSKGKTAYGVPPDEFVARTPVFGVRGTSHTFSSPGNEQVEHSILSAAEEGKLRLPPRYLL
jgi:hypothetical protein